MMRDAKGNAVCANGKLVEDFFKAADLSDSHQVVLTLSDGTRITLMALTAVTPPFSFSARYTRP